MNNNLTEIAVIVDRSGSMKSIWSDTLGGLRQFVADQKKLEGEANFTLNIFDNEFLPLVTRAKVLEVDLDKFQFGPRGNTALYDALGRSIQTLSEQIEATSEADRPAKVIVAIFTDGAENASTEYSQKRVFDLIQAKEAQDGWSFLFLAAGKEAMLEGERLGIASNRRVFYDATGEDTTVAYESLSAVVFESRSLPPGEFRNQRDKVNLSLSFREKKAKKQKKA